MQYSRVYMNSIAYELAPVVVSSGELEARLQPAYEALHIASGQLQALTGIRERRWWQENQRVSDGAIVAARKALAGQQVKARDLGAVIYAGVCRDQYEPATACHVAAALGVQGNTAVYDLSNACLGVLSAILDIANRIELGQIRAGLVVACESSREINETMLQRLINTPSMPLFSTSLATFTGGSGAAAVLLTDGSFSSLHGQRVLGGIEMAAPQYHDLCCWGTTPISPEHCTPYMKTDAVGVLNHGVELGTQTWQAFCKTMQWQTDTVDKTICHQVGEGHQRMILQALGLDPNNDFSTFPYLGNMGTVSLPITAAIAQERGMLRTGDKVAFLGIGSGLNCLMLAVQW
ncbi:MAG: 3-oxoacyl-ACP synthase III [Mariprofundaceae bacterium]|nr:3-oxoacyl-ACP synthase III [Mariprofundaceae bacterium]